MDGGLEEGLCEGGGDFHLSAVPIVFALSILLFVKQSYCHCFRVKNIYRLFVLHVLCLVQMRR